MKPVYIRETDGDRRLIGHIKLATFVSQRIERKHLYKGGQKTLTQARKDDTIAWGIDALACDGMLERGIVMFRVESDKNTYEVQLEDMKNHEESFVLHHKPHRAQYFLPVRHFKVLPKP